VRVNVGLALVVVFASIVSIGSDGVLWLTIGDGDDITADVVGLLLTEFTDDGTPIELLGKIEADSDIDSDTELVNDTVAVMEVDSDIEAVIDAEAVIERQLLMLILRELRCEKWLE